MSEQSSPHLSGPPAGPAARQAARQAAHQAAAQGRCDALRKGISTAQAGNKLLARLHLLEAAETTPHDPDCWLWLAWVADSPNAAVQALERALQADPQHELAQVGLRWARALVDYRPEVPRDAAAATQAVLPDEPAPAATEPVLVEAADTEAVDAEPSEPVVEHDGAAVAEAPTEFETDAPDVSDAPVWSVVADDAEAVGDPGDESSEVPADEAEARLLTWRGWSESDADGPAAAEPDSTVWMLRLSTGGETGDDLDPASDPADDSADEPAAEVAAEPQDESDNAPTGWHEQDEAGERETDAWEAVAVSEPADPVDEFDTELETVEAVQASAEVEAEKFAADPEPGDDAADAVWAVETEPETEAAAEAAEVFAEVEPVSDDVELSPVEAAAAEPVMEPVMEPVAAEPVANREHVGHPLPSAEETAEAELSEAETLAAEDVEAVAEPDGPPRVLVVDDSPTVRKLVAMTLGKRGYEVAAAGDGIEALKRIAEVRPGLILMDIAMPKLGGYQLCKLVKKHKLTKHIPVVMLSGKDGMFDKMRGKLVGSADYVTKPFDPEQLTQKVEKYLPAPTSAGRE
jgi:twitching motility two-component system response regulator PilG